MAGRNVEAGTTQELLLKVSELYTGQPINVPVTVVRGLLEGPTLFLTAAIHGDELNGVEIVRQASLRISHRRMRGTLVCVPVVNRFGFIHQSRYLPDRRDLNRSFPGSPRGSSAARLASVIFREIVLQSDFGIDFHTAAAGRVNLPHVRGDMAQTAVRRLARAFGAEFVMDQPGGRQSLRSAATSAGVPCVVYEAGESFKFQRREVQKGLFGVYSVMSELRMLDISRRKPRFQVIVKKSEWVRAERGGMLDLTVRPGDLVYKGDLLGRITNPFGKEVVSIESPTTGVVIGTTTIPVANPGDPVAHIARLKSTLKMVERHARVGPGGRARIDVEF